MSNNHGSGWANPGPAGLVALAIACFTFFAVLSGKCTGEGNPLLFLGIWLIGGFVVQLCVGLIELKEGNLLGGNTFLFFSAFFMLVGGLEFIFEFFAGVHGWKINAGVDGWAWLVLFLILIPFTIAFLKQTAASLGLAVVILFVGVFFVTFSKLGMLGASAHTYAAWCLLIAGILALYTSGATVLNGAFGRTVLPVGSPLI
jgi:hypothetical protein